MAAEALNGTDAMSSTTTEAVHLNPDTGPECRLVGGAGTTMQLLLVIIAFNCLVLKRYWELPRRSWRIWFYDASKQGTAAVVVHVMNLYLSNYQMKAAGTKDECTFYFTNILLDATLGLLLVYLMLRGTTYIIQRKRWHFLQSGDYGNPPRWQPWLAQLVLYNSISIFEKLLVSLILLSPGFMKIGEVILNPVGRVSVRLELAIALVITPLVITIIWFWCVDNFLMSVETKHQQKGAKRRMTTGSQFAEAMNERLVDSDLDDEFVEMTIGIGTSSGVTDFMTTTSRVGRPVTTLDD